MGCGSSVDKNNEGGQNRRGNTEGDATKSYPSQQQPAAGNNPTGPSANPYRQPGDNDAGNETTTLAAADGDANGGLQINQQSLADLRARSTERDRQQGSTVGRWIEAIVEPTEQDSADVYDPLQRHKLSMESLNQRFSGGPGREQ